MVGIKLIKMRKKKKKCWGTVTEYMIICFGEEIADRHVIDYS